MKLNKLREYFGIIFSVIWITIFRVIIVPDYNIGDFRLFLFLGIIIGLASNFLSYKNRFIRILVSTMYLMVLGFIYDWYFFINHEIIMSPHSFLNLVASGTYSIDKIFSFSSQFFLAINSKVVIVYLVSICTLIIFNFINLEKIRERVNFKILFQTEGKNNFLFILSAIFILSLINQLFSILHAHTFYNSLTDLQKTHFPKPSGLTIQIILYVFIFTFVKVYGLFLLTIKTKMKLLSIILTYFVLVFVTQYLYDLIFLKSINKYSCISFFDNSIFIVLEMILITYYMRRYKPIIGFLIAVLCIWLLNVVYQTFLYAPENIFGSIIVEFKRIYAPIIAGLIAGITYLSMEKLSLKNTQPNNL